VHQRHGFLADAGRARRIAKVDALIEQLAQQQSLGQRGGQDQAGVGDQVLVIEADRDGVGTAAGSHLTGAFLIGSSGRFSNPFFQVNRHPFAVSGVQSEQITGGSDLRNEAAAGVWRARDQAMPGPRGTQVQIWSLTRDSQERTL
jgi:hypothetical protein